MSTLWLGLIAVFSSITAPLILVLLTNWQRRKEREEQWERDDAVAAQAAEAAELLRKAQEAAAAQAEEAAALLLDANERVAETSALTNGKLDVIHTLVNSSLTAAMQAELDATEAQLVLMREVVDLKYATGKKPSAESLALIVAKQDQISELKAKMDDRLTQAGAGGE